MRSDRPQNGNEYDPEKLHGRRWSSPSGPSESSSSTSDVINSADKSEGHQTSVQEQTVDETPDLGLQLTCSYRAGVNPQQLEAEHPPDGGLKAWLQVLGSHITVFCTWGFINGFGVFQSYYVDALNATPSAISWIGSIQTFLLFFVGTFTGRALDAGYFYVVYRAGCALILLGIFTTSVATSYWHVLLSQGVCCGLGAGLLFCPTVALTSTYFSKRRGLALGISATGSATGGIVIAVIVQQLLPAIGFGWTMRVIGFVALGLLTVSNAILRTRVKARKTGGLIDVSALRDMSYVCFTIGMFLTFLGLYFGFFYLSSFAKARLNLPQATSFTLLIILNCVGIPGRIIPNYVADRIGPMNLLIPMVLLGGVLVFVWIAIASHAGLMVWAAIYGIFASAVQSLFPATMASLTTDLSKAGTRMGMVFSTISLACLTGTPIGGAFIQSMDGKYWGAQTFAGACMIAGAVVLCFARGFKVGWGLGRA